MSRGPGWLQSAILKAVGSYPAATMTTETLRWSLMEQERPLEVADDDMPPRWSTSFQRAVEGLKERVTITPRRLANFQECIEHYPGKTLKGRMRAIRKVFLPVLFKGKTSNELSPRYDVEENERFLIELLKKETTEFDGLQRRWVELESRLRPLYGAADKSFDLLLRVICKGRQLFRPGEFGYTDIKATFAISEAIESVCRSNLVPEDLAKDLREFVTRFMPSNVADEVKLRSFIHGIANMPSIGKGSLNDETLAYLHQQRPAEVEALPGFDVPKDQKFLRWQHHKPKYPPDLKKLFDQSVFQEFNFISLK